MSSSFRILRATRKIIAGDTIGEDNFHEDFVVKFRVPTTNPGTVLLAESVRGVGAPCR